MKTFSHSKFKLKKKDFEDFKLRGVAPHIHFVDIFPNFIFLIYLNISMLKFRPQIAKNTSFIFSFYLISKLKFTPQITKNAFIFSVY